MSVNNTKQGALIYDREQGRMDIRFGLNDYYGGLHCGDTMEVYHEGRWIPTRIEKASNWFLSGINTKSLPGLLVRIS